MQLLGILAAVGAMLGWGIGDFLYHRSVKRVGIIKSIFFYGIFGFLMLTPFVSKDIVQVLKDPKTDLILFGMLVSVLISVLFISGAFHKGKLAVIEPVVGLELPLTVIISVVIGHENVSVLQGILILLIFISTLLIVSKTKPSLFFKKRTLEEGIFLALVGAVGLAFANYITAYIGRELSPFFAVWFFRAFEFFIALIYLSARGELAGVAGYLAEHIKVLLPMGVISTLGWLSYAASARFISIPIATAISESYVALAVLLGILVGRERLGARQMLGIAIAAISVMIISLV